MAEREATLDQRGGVGLRRERRLGEGQAQLLGERARHPLRVEAAADEDLAQPFTRPTLLLERGLEFGLCDGAGLQEETAEHARCR